MLHELPLYLYRFRSYLFQRQAPLEFYPMLHNVENYMAAIAAVSGLVSKDVIVNVAKTFGGVEQRIELVRTLDGVKYYNSSIDSSPTER